MKKATRKVLFVLAFVVGLSYFAFTILFFDPFEEEVLGAYEGSAVAIEYVVPKNVDYFVHKRGLEDDFRPGEFPVPAAWEDVELSRPWQRFARTSLHAELAESLGVDETIEEIRRACREVPVLDPLTDLLGKDLAVFGRVAGRGFDESETCIVAAGTRMAKLAYEAAGQAWLRGLLSIPIEVEEDEYGVRRVTLEDGTTIHLYRHHEVFVLGTGPLLVREVIGLLDDRERSLGYARAYHATVAQDVDEWAGLRRDRQEVTEDEVGERVQVHGDLRTLFSRTEADERFLEHRGQVSRWILGRMFNPRYFETVTLDLGFGDVLDLRGNIVFNKDAAAQAESGFYDRKTFELKKAMDGAAALLPDETFFVMAARIDPGQFLPSLIRGLEQTDPAAKELLDDLIRRVRKFRPDFRPGTSMEAVRTIASWLGQDIVVAMVRDTYFGPPARPTPIIAIFLTVDERGPTFDVLDRAQGNPAKATGYNGFVYPLMKAHSRLQQEGRGIAKWYRVWHEVKGSPNERFIQDVILKGTDIQNISFGIIDPAEQTKGPWRLAITLSPRAIDMVVPEEGGGTRTEERGTAHELITDFIKLSSKGNGESAWAQDYHNGGNRRIDSLLKSEKYREGSDFLEGFASVALYLDAAGMKEVLLDHARLVADSGTQIDWRQVKAGIEEELLAGEFSSWKGREMPQGVRERFEQAVLERTEQIERERKMTAVPVAQKEFEEGLTWLELFKDAFLAARIDERSFNIELRAKVRTNLDE
ncbi:MAG: hypothetical protein ACF8XB_16045 [Planctomycetota bacterium JB042]